MQSSSPRNVKGKKSYIRRCMHVCTGKACMYQYNIDSASACTSARTHPSRKPPGPRHGNRPTRPHVPAVLRAIRGPEDPSVSALVLSAMPGQRSERHGSKFGRLSRLQMVRTHPRWGSHLPAKEPPPRLRDMVVPSLLQEPVREVRLPGARHGLLLQVFAVPVLRMLRTASAHPQTRPA